MKAAVIGCGNVAKMHLEALKKNQKTEIIAVVDIKPERADSAAAQYGARAYYDFDELLKNEKPDCVHICTPHYLHTSMAISALEAGINVITEKPCSVTADEVDALRKAQQSSGMQVGVCFQNRYNACVQYVMNVIENCEMGKIKSIRAFVTWDRGADYYSDDWHGTLEKECGGVLINQAIHTVDLVQYFGGGCKNVTAHVSNDHLKGIIEVEDTASLLMELEGGVTAILYATTAYAENSGVMIEIAFEKGTLRLEGEMLFSIGADGKITEILERPDVIHHGQSYWGASHGSLINDFYDCLESGEKFIIDAFEGGKAAKLVAAAYESSKTGKTVQVERS